MAKGAYITWTASEENNLQPWLSEHRWMSWERRAEEYSKQHNKDRSFESLRGKYNQLQKGIRRRRPISNRMSAHTRTVARRARYRHQRLPKGFPPHPPVFRPQTPDPWARRILQQQKISETSLPKASTVTLQFQYDHEPPSPAYHVTPVYISPKPFFRRRKQPLFVSQLWEKMRRIHISTGETGSD